MTGIHKEPKPYRGPVIYIVHGPLDEKISHQQKEHNPSTRQWDANLKKIREAVKKAALRNVPVIHESSNSDHRAFQHAISGMGAKPRIVLANAADAAEIIRSEKIEPTRFILLGHYRDLCVRMRANLLRRDFPAAELDILNGSSTVYSKTLPRGKYRQKIKEIGMKSSRKLNPRHFV